jgi:N-acetyl-anhydromuramyl-L-alanine amidase AmpD
MGKVRRPYERVKMSVRNQSERSGSIELIVLHSTESHDYAGLSDLRAIGAWFDNPAAEASAHVCVDKQGYSARYVPDGRKAWHAVKYNSASLGIEQIGFARFGWARWRLRLRQRRKVAKFIAYWAKKYGIPIRRGEVSNGKVTLSGVVTHRQLGSAGGNHDDPGSYPFNATLRMARRYLKRGW